jgi:hypothetical protein
VTVEGMGDAGIGEAVKGPAMGAEDAIFVARSVDAS